MPEEKRKRSSELSADGRFLSLGSVAVKVQHTALLEYPPEEKTSKGRSAVEKYNAETRAHRQAVFDFNGKVADLICEDVIDEEEARKLFKNPGITALPGNSYTSDGRWPAVFPLFPEPQQRHRREQPPETNVHAFFTAAYLADQERASLKP